MLVYAGRYPWVYAIWIRDRSRIDAAIGDADATSVSQAYYPEPQRVWHETVPRRPQR